VYNHVHSAASGMANFPSYQATRMPTVVVGTPPGAFLVSVACIAPQLRSANKCCPWQHLHSPPPQLQFEARMYIRRWDLLVASKRQSQRAHGCDNDSCVNQMSLSCCQRWLRQPRVVSTMAVSTTGCVNDGCANRDIGGSLATAGT